MLGEAGGVPMLGSLATTSGELVEFTGPADVVPGAGAVA